ncbi:hypothetical protein [Streptomyces sp. KL116D]|uniref:hypothetical protein n=1 Tax=Streptomyces sp. KL116D TaxID=3045152 RepID=UPI003556CD42
MSEAHTPLPRAVALVSCGLLAVTALSGCGGSDSDEGSGKGGGGKDEGRQQSPAQVVQATSEKTTQAGSARIKLTTTASSGGRSETVTGAGVMDLRDGTSRIELGQGGQHIEQRVVDQVLYQKPPKGSGGLPGGKSWLKIDLQRLRDAGGKGAAQVSDPADSFAYSKSLSEKDVKKVGTERLNGVSTTHYRVNVDVDKLAKSSPEQAKKLRESLGDTLPMDVWIDGRGLLRRQQIELSTNAKSGGGASGNAAAAKAGAKVVMDLTDFGTDVDVKAPSAADTADMTDKAVKESRRSA